MAPFQGKPTPALPFENWLDDELLPGVAGEIIFISYLGIGKRIGTMRS
jgi:hypothetical protein